MAFPTTGVLDTFTRIDAAALGANWTEGDLLGGDNFEIVSNQVQNTGAQNVEASARWNVETFGADSEAFCILVTIPNVDGDRFGIAARIVSPGSSTFDGYGASIRKGAANISMRLQEWLNGNDTDIGAEAVITFVAGDSLGLEIIGTAIKGYRNNQTSWSEEKSEVDGTYTAAGYIGLTSWEVGSTGQPTLDDFGGGTVVAAGVGGLRNPLAGPTKLRAPVGGF